MEVHRPDVVALTETFLNSSVNSGELFPPGYIVLRKDRVGDVGWGGVLIAVKDVFNVQVIDNIDGLTVDKEVLFVSIARRGIKFVLCVVYLPPNYSTERYLGVLACIENAICMFQSSKIVLLGDFNLNSFNSSVKSQFDSFTSFCNLRQHNTVTNEHGGILDLVFTNISDAETSVQCSGDVLVPADAYHPPLSISLMFEEHHFTVSGDSSPTTSARALQSPRWNFKKADLSSVYTEIADIDWAHLYKQVDVDNAADILYNNLHSILNRNVPVHNYPASSFQQRYEYPVWFTAEIIKYVKLKHFNLVTYKRRGLLFNKELFRYYRALVKKLMESAHKQYLRRTEEAISYDPAAFWRHIKDRRSNRRPNCYTTGGVRLAEPDAVQAFAEHFSSVFHVNPPALDVDKAASGAAGGKDSTCIILQSISPRELSRIVRKLKATAAPGPDGIPAFLIKDCFSKLKLPLLFVFNLALREGVYPTQWKVSRVTPVPKEVKATDIAMFRPIAVLSVFGKIFEGVINGYIAPLISSRLSEEQHGFRRGRSTATNVGNFVDYTLIHMDQSRQVDAAYFDFQKAFDLVDNDILLSKLSAFGFSPHLLKLFGSYLRDRRQYVQVSGYQSDEYFTRSGVSQGSTLGPTLFLVMINDLPSVVSSVECLLFADDLKLFYAVNSVSDCGVLQQDIDAVAGWSQANRLFFNTKKCKVISFSRSKCPLAYTYLLSNDPIDRVQTIRDLGLELDTKLDFHGHICSITKSANKMLGFVMRTAPQFTSTAVPIVLYNAYVRSKLEYSSVIWDPIEASYTLLLERVQRKFARYLYKKQYGYYPFLYPSLFVAGMVGLETLHFRRKFHLAVHYSLLLRGQIDNPVALEGIRLFVPEQYRRAGRRRRPLFAEPAAAGLRTCRASNAPGVRASALLNELELRQDADVFADSWQSLVTKIRALCTNV